MLKLNVVLSKKVGLPDYGSIGALCSVETEMNNGVLQHDPDGFQQQARQAYAACAQAVNDELARQQGQSASPPVTNGHTANGNGRRRNGAQSHRQSGQSPSRDCRPPGRRPGRSAATAFRRRIGGRPVNY